MILPAVQHIIPSSLCICSVTLHSKPSPGLTSGTWLDAACALSCPLANHSCGRFPPHACALDFLLEWSLVHPAGAASMTPPQIRPRFGINLQYGVFPSLCISSPSLTDTGDQICCFLYYCVSPARTELLELSCSKSSCHHFSQSFISPTFSRNILSKSTFWTQLYSWMTFPPENNFKMKNSFF